MLVLGVCGVRQNLYVYSLYRNPDLDDRIFSCLLASMVAVQDEDIGASFLFVGYLNGNHQEWLGSTTTNRHEVAALDLATVSGCDQLVVGPTHACGKTLDLLMTDVVGTGEYGRETRRMANYSTAILGDIIVYKRDVWPTMCMRF